jgi:hypothetical protein
MLGNRDVSARSTIRRSWQRARSASRRVAGAREDGVFIGHHFDRTFFARKGHTLPGGNRQDLPGGLARDVSGDSGQRKRRTSHDVRRSMFPQSKAASVHVASLQSVYLTRRGNFGTWHAARNGQILPGVCGGGFSAGLGLRDFRRNTTQHGWRDSRSAGWRGDSTADCLGDSHFGDPRRGDDLNVTANPHELRCAGRGCAMRGQLLVELIFPSHDDSLDVGTDERGRAAPR